MTENATSSVLYIWNHKNEDMTDFNNNNKTNEERSENGGENKDVVGNKREEESGDEGESSCEVDFERVCVLDGFGLVDVWSSPDSKVVGIDKEGKLRCFNILSSTRVSLLKGFESFNKVSVKRVSCGAQHWLILCNDGKLFVCGSNSDGQIGLGDLKEVNEPVHLNVGTIKKDSCIVQICAGGRHSIFVTEENEIFSFGCGRNGRCGHGAKKYTERVTKPRRIDYLKINQLKEVVKICCGWSHSLVLLNDDSGKSFVFSFGRGSQGQCGTGYSRDEYLPFVVGPLLGHDVVDVAAGYYHSVALTKDGRVFTFGGDKEGQCGHPASSPHYHLLPKLIDSLLHLDISLISAGAFTTLISASPRSHDAHSVSSTSIPEDLSSLSNHKLIQLILDLKGNNLSPRSNSFDENSAPVLSETEEQSSMYIFGQCGNSVERGCVWRVKSLPKDGELLQVSSGMHRTIALFQVSRKRAEEESERSFRKSFGFPPQERLLHTHTCSILVNEREHSGTLYISTSKVCFQSDDEKGWQIKIAGDFSSIVSIEKTGWSYFPAGQGISVFLEENEMKFIQFPSEEERQEVFVCLQEMWCPQSIVFGDSPTISRAAYHLHHHCYQDFLGEEEGGMPPPTRDVYGFALRKDEGPRYLKFAINFGKKYAQKLRWWQKMDMVSLTELGKNNATLRKAVRAGVPGEFRGEIWYILSGAKEKAQRAGNYYQYLVRKIERLPDPTSDHDSAKEIEMDVYRTFSEDLDSIPSEWLHSLRRVLLAYYLRNPSLGYCQSMNVLAGVFLFFMEEEKAFWTLVVTVEDILHGYFNKSMLGLLVDMGIFEQKMATHFPYLTNHLQQISFPLAVVASKWFMCLFFGSLPSETALRLWDIFFLEGFRIMFAIAAALVKDCQKDLMECRDECSAAVNLSEYARSCFDFDRLLKSSTEIRGGFFDEDEFRELRFEHWCEKQKITKEAEKRKEEMRRRNEAKHEKLLLEETASDFDSSLDDLSSDDPL